MCDKCRVEQREYIKAGILGLLAGETNGLSKAMDRAVPKGVAFANKRIDAAIAANPEIERPTDEEIESAVRDALLGAILATAGATLASSTPGYTEEGCMPTYVILGTWAGSILENQSSEIEGHLRSVLGMSSN